MPVANMLTARMNLGVGAIKDMRDAVTGTTFNAIYAIGGYSGKAILGSAEKYDIQTDTWSEIAPMKTPRRNVGELCENRPIELPNSSKSCTNVLCPSVLPGYVCRYWQGLCLALAYGISAL